MGVAYRAEFIAPRWFRLLTAGQLSHVSHAAPACGAPPAPKARYNRCMHLAIFAMRFFEVLFFLGLAGSAVVIVISFIEDAKELFGKD